MEKRYPIFFTVIFYLFVSCKEKSDNLLIIDKQQYQDQLQGFWLGQCIANWTGLVTEMDKIGNIGEIKTGDFYTREDWGRMDQPSIWGQGLPSDLSPTIDFVFRDTDEIWGADDDTDIEYIYQFTLANSKNLILSPRQIADAWMKHIKVEEENYLWVSNQRAFDLMREGVLPPETSNPEFNEHFDMIDAQLTTEIFGLYAPGRPDIAIEMASLPIRTTAREEAQEIAEFYVRMYSLAALNPHESLKDRIWIMAERSAGFLDKNSYVYDMYQFVKNAYLQGKPWEETRDLVYQRYQVEQQASYAITSKNLYCNGCFAAGINYAASLISLFYGEGDLSKTIKIGALCGWDSDNPTATWGGMIGFMIGKSGVEKHFGRRFSNRFDIHRTRQNFPDAGIDDFTSMAEQGISITDRVVQELILGKSTSDQWEIPLK